MIRFACPACNSVINSPDHKAGKKVSCPKCGQRLQIPGAPLDHGRTVLGSLLPGQRPKVVTQPPAGAAAPRPQKAVPAPTVPPLPRPPVEAPALPPPSLPLPDGSRRLPRWVVPAGIVAGVLVLGLVVVVVLYNRSEPTTCDELCERLEKRGMRIKWARIEGGGSPSTLIIRSAGPKLPRVVSNEDAFEISCRCEAVYVIRRVSEQDARDAALLTPPHYYCFTRRNFVIFGDYGLAQEIEKNL